MKRMLCLFLALILVVGICFSSPVTITASAAFTLESGTEHTVGAVYIDSTTGVKFKITDIETKQVEVCGYSNLQQYLVIPATVNISENGGGTLAYSVTAIGASAFANCTSLYSVVIPECVITIGESAFYNCTSLTTIEIPGSVTTINLYTFNGCTSLTTVTIPSSVTSIDRLAFNGCTKLTTVNVPCNWDGSIYSFAESKLKIAEHNTTKSATCISKAKCSVCGEYGDFAPHTYKNGKCTAEGCGYACAHETITDGVCVACRGRHCGKTENDKVVWFYDVNTTILIISGEGEMADFTDTSMPWYNCIRKITRVVINKGVTSIGESAFAKCTLLEAVKIGEDVTTIGDYAFAYCNFLKSVTMGDRVTSIGASAFAECAGLTSVTIPDSVTTISGLAFLNCSNLTSVTIPKNVTTIDRYAFDGCAALTSINVDDANTKYSSVDGVLFNKDKTELIYYPLGKTETSYTVPDSVTKIGEGAFINCTALTSVTIGEDVTEIDDYAFDGCNNLSIVNVPCDWDTENPLYAFDENVNVDVADHKEIIYVDNNDGTHTEKYSCCGTVIGEPGKHSFNESEYCEFCGHKCPHEKYSNGVCAVCGCYCSHTNTEPVYKSNEDNTNRHYKYYECCGLEEWAGYHEDENGDTKCDQCEVQLVAKAYLEPWTSQGVRMGDNYFVSLENAVDKVNEIYGEELILLSDATIAEDKTITLESAVFNTNGNKLTVNGILVLSAKKYTGVTIPDGVIGSGTIKIGENTFKFADNEKWSCAEESQHTSSVQTCVGYLCELCGNYYGEANDSHDIVIDEAKAPTCTKTGLTEGEHCTRCDYKITQEEIPALNHKDTLVQVEAKAKTCTTIGWEAYEYCTACDYTTYVEIPASHELQEVKAKAPTCTEIGYDAYKYCTECDYTTYVEKSKLGHDIATDKAVAATCTKTGLTEGSHCTRCDGATVAQQTIAKKAHTEVTVTGKVATCTQSGLTDGKKCSVCGTVTKAQETIKAKGHTEVTVTGKSATCTATGLTDGKKCSVCGTVTVAQETIKATGHKEVVIPAVAPTYKAVGKTEGKKCSVCGTITIAQKDVAKLTLAVPTVTIKNTAKGINVSWNKVDGAESYIVYKRTYNEKTKKWSSWSRLKTGVTATSYTDTTVKLSTKYRYTVKSVNGDVASEYTSTSTLKYNVTPTVKVANASNGVKVSWSTAANATGYRVYRSQYNTKTKKWSDWKNMGTAKADKTSWTDKSVKAGVQYKYTVRAMNGDLKSSYNKSGVATMFLAQPTVKIANNAKGVKVTWNKIAGAKGYTVYRSEYVNGKWSSWKNLGTIKNANIVSWVDKSAKSGTTYRYTLRAVNGSYKSSYKASGSLIYLAQPTVTVKSVSNGINVSWTKSSGATGYTVYRSELVNGEWSKWTNMGTAKSDKKSWTDKKAKKGVTYKYTVRAVNGKVRSSYKASSSITK